MASAADPAVQANKIYAISDIHVDHKDNWAFIDSWSPHSYQGDVLIVGGDVTDNMTLLRATFDSLKSKFKEVFYVPGEVGGICPPLCYILVNHD